MSQGGTSIALAVFDAEKCRESPTESYPGSLYLAAPLGCHRHPAFLRAVVSGGQVKSLGFSYRYENPRAPFRQVGPASSSRRRNQGVPEQRCALGSSSIWRCTPPWPRIYLRAALAYGHIPQSA